MSPCTPSLGIQTLQNEYKIQLKVLPLFCERPGALRYQEESH